MVPASGARIHASSRCFGSRSAFSSSNEFRDPRDSPNKPAAIHVTLHVIDHLPAERRCDHQTALERTMTAENTKPGRGYIYVEMTIKDPVGFKQYTALSAPAVQTAGGRYIVRGTRPEFLEGSTEANRIVIVEFGTVAKARAFYHSAAYQAARLKRLSAAEFRMTLVEGAAAT
jgi:uncharacterized protein (DUF1330 family)